MPNLLKGKRVFLDTQVFRKAWFGFSRPAFKKLLMLCRDGDVILVTTLITRREIEAQIEEIAPDIKKTLGRANSIMVGLGFPEITVQGNSSATVSEVQIATLMKNSVEAFFRDCNVEQIEFPKTALHNVFELYFEHRAPFGTAKKKSEFPDAFVLEALKSKAGENGESIYVVSEDADLQNACKQAAHLEHLPSLPHFLDLWNVHLDLVKKVRATMRANAVAIDQKLDEIIAGLAGEMDCPGAVKISHRKIIDVLDSLIISCEESKASVEFICFVEFDAWLEIHPPVEASPEYRHAEPRQSVSVTLDFDFDPSDPHVFSVQSYWSPQSVTFSAHSAS